MSRRTIIQVWVLTKEVLLLLLATIRLRENMIGIDLELVNLLLHRLLVNFEFQVDTLAYKFQFVAKLA